MALSIEQREQIIALYKQGNLSNVAIAKKVGCGETAVRRIIKEVKAEKGEIKHLAEREVQNIIIGNEIEKRKGEFTKAEKRAYQEELLTMSEALNLFNNSAVETQLLANDALNEIKQGILDNTTTALDNLPNILGITKITESNRKQMVGITETYKPKEETKEESLTVTFK